MPRLSKLRFITALLLAKCTSAQYSATYLPSNAPDKTQNGQAGTNQCGTALNQTSECQNAYSGYLKSHLSTLIDVTG
jgi:hypothetical protein